MAACSACCESDGKVESVQKTIALNFLLLLKPATKHCHMFLAAKTKGEN